MFPDTSCRQLNSFAIDAFWKRKSLRCEQKCNSAKPLLNGGFSFVKQKVCRIWMIITENNAFCMECGWHGINTQLIINSKYHSFAEIVDVISLSSFSSSVIEVVWFNEPAMHSDTLVRFFTFSDSDLFEIWVSVIASIVQRCFPSFKPTDCSFPYSRKFIDVKL